VDNGVENISYFLKDEVKILPSTQKDSLVSIVLSIIYGLKKSSVHRGMYCTRSFVIKLVRPMGDAKSLNGSSVPKF
jgi:hypothetical protein